MDKAKYTPAPWQLSLSDDTVVIHIGKDGVHNEVATIDGDYNQPETWPIMEANARLIAAAPELLEALLEILGPLNVCSDNHNVEDSQTLPVDMTMGELRKARAAIAKATHRKC